MKAIPTTYRGIEYRSRLEARWSAFFDQLGWRHTYEPFDGNGYIPDFLVESPIQPPFVVEVKPAITNEQYENSDKKVSLGLQQHWSGPVMYAGLTPLPSSVWQAEFYPTCAGFMTDPTPTWCDSCASKYWKEGHLPTADYADKMGELCPHMGHWYWPAKPVAMWVNLHGYIELWYEYEPPPNQFFSDLLTVADGIRISWADACNAVKWRGRDTELAQITSLGSTRALDKKFGDEQ